MDRSHLAPGTALTSAMRRDVHAVVEVSQQTIDGTSERTMTPRSGMAEDAVGSACDPATSTPDDARADVLTERIKAGGLEVEGTANP